VAAEAQGSTALVLYQFIIWSITSYGDFLAQLTLAGLKSGNGNTLIVIHKVTY
jgi:hypothetical protein